MNSRHKRLAISTAFLLMFSISQVYVGASFAGSDPRPSGSGVATADIGVLVTSGRQAILVNGNNAVTDATILSGASIESPQGVSATINLGRLGRLDIAASTSLTLTFSAGRIKVTLLKGCVILLTKKNTTGTIENAKGGVIGITNPAKDDVLDVCQNEFASPLVNQGAAASAGAGASGASSAAAAATAAGGLSETAGVLIGAIGGGAMIAATFLVLPCDRAPDPSPSLGTHCR